MDTKTTQTSLLAGSIILLLLCIPVSSYATPSISSVSGTWGHKQTVTISGSNLYDVTAGTQSKSPVAPLIWDATDDTSTDTIATFYNGQNWPAPTWPASYGAMGDTNISGSHITYRTSYPDLGGTPMTMAHSRVTKYLCYALTTYGGVWISGTGGVSWTQDPVDYDGVWFAMVWYRVHPDYSYETNPTETDDLKEFSHNGPGGIGGSPYRYSTWCGGDGTPGTCVAENCTYNTYTPWEGGLCPDSEPYIHYVPNPMYKWIHVEHKWDTSGFGMFGSDGTGTWAPYNNLLLPEVPLNTNTDSYTLGGYAKIPRSSAFNNYRYWSGIYIDYSYARVMLGSANTWDASVIREPQIPQNTFNDTSIEIQVNLGAFTGSSAYLYVFDKDDNISAAYGPVTLDQGGGTTTVPATTTTTPSVEGATIIGGTCQ